MDVLAIDTPHGPANAHLRLVEEPRGAVVLGHGAGGGISAPDLVAATAAATDAGFSVALVEQPYRVAGRRSPAPAHHLDTAWTVVVEHLAAGPFAGPALVVGGRSLGARVACRTAEATGAGGVVCLAYPLKPPGRATSPSRIPELDAVSVPTLVVQGERDPYGMPPAGPQRTVVPVAGDHGLKADLPAVADAVRSWLEQLATRAR